jgi:hypothetical protein
VLRRTCEMTHRISNTQGATFNRREGWWKTSKGRQAIVNVEPQGKKQAANEETDKGYKCGELMLLMLHASRRNPHHAWESTESGPRDSWLWLNGTSSMSLCHVTRSLISDGTQPRLKKTTMEHLYQRRRSGHSIIFTAYDKGARRTRCRHCPRRRTPSHKTYSDCPLPPS